MTLGEGDAAPPFSAVDQNGTITSLSQFKGKWLALYFYPKDFTSGCTKEACEFRDNYEVLKKLAAVIGVSADSQESHAKFAVKYALPFTLLADEEKIISRSYGAQAVILTRRFTFLIDPDGKIAKIYRSVDPVSHARIILKDLKKLQE